MENFEKNENKKAGSEKTPEEKFYDEIEILCGTETRKKDAGETSYNNDLIYIKTEELTEDDMKIWEGYKTLVSKKNLTEEDVKKYEKKRMEYWNKTAEQENESRKHFAAFIANKMFVIVNRNWNFKK